MKKISLLLLLFTLASVATEAQSIQEELEPPIGGQGGPAFRMTSIAGNNAIMIGNYSFARFRRITVGGGGFALIHTSDLEVPVSFGYGGSTVGYTDRIGGPLLYVVQIMLGAGGIQAGNVSTGAFVGEAEIMIAIEALPFMRFTAGAGYRLVAGVDLPTYTNSDFSGANISLGMMFGNF